jgi:hypothetical protein
MHLGLDREWITQDLFLRWICNYANFEEDRGTSCGRKHGKLVIGEDSAIQVNYGTVLTVDIVSMVMRRPESCHEHLVSNKFGASYALLKVWIAF